MNNASSLTDNSGASMNAADTVPAFHPQPHGANGAAPHRPPGPMATNPGVPTGLASDVAIKDLDDPLTAVKARLTQIVGKVTEPASAQNTEAQSLHAVLAVQTGVLECVSALDQLHATLKHELARCSGGHSDTSMAAPRPAKRSTDVGRGRPGAENRAMHMALHDGLTSLPNRSFLRLRLNNAMARTEPECRPLVLLCIHIDGFKAICDAHGQAVGTDLLSIVAARLTRAVREEDLVSRIAENEFICQLGGAPGQEQLSHLARKFFLAVAAPFKIGDLTIRARPSIGIARYPADATTADTLLANVSAAMLRAQEQQTGYAFYRASEGVSAG